MEKSARAARQNARRTALGPGAIAAWQGGDRAFADTHRRATLVRNLNDPLVARALGYTALQSGRYEEAARLLCSIAKTPPDYSNLGISLEALGQHAEAEAAYLKPSAIDPTCAPAHYNLGNALSQAGQADEAIGEYEQALRLKPDYAEAHRNLALALEQTHRVREAIGEYEQALRIKPDRPAVQNNLAWLLATLPPAEGGDPVRAVTLAEQACQLTNNRMPPYLDTLAAAYAAAGRFDDAVATAQKAIDLANSAGLPQVVKQIESRLQLYRRGQPYRGAADATSPPKP